MGGIRNKTISLLLVLAVLLGTAVPVMAETNTQGIEFLAELDRNEVTVSGSDRTVKMTIKTSQEVTIDSLGYQIVYDPEILTLERVEGDDQNLVIQDHDVNYERGIVSWQFEDDPVTTDTLSVITFRVKRDAAPGKYSVGVTGLKLSEDWGMTAIERNGSASAVLTVSDKPAEPAFVLQSLLLNGKIGVNFFMDLPEMDGVDYSDSYMEFTVCGKTQRAGYDENYKNLTGEYYGFICYVNSIQMADRIAAVFHYGKDQTVSMEYSVADYVSRFQEHASEYNEKTVNMVAALADYGHYIQPFLADSRSWEIGTDHREMAAINELTDSDIAEAVEKTTYFTVSRDIGDAMLEKVTFSLTLDTDTAINIYLQKKPDFNGNMIATIGETTVNAAVKQKDGRYRVVIGNLPAYQLGETSQVRVLAGSEMEVRISALSYVHELLTSTSEEYRDNDRARKAMTALYRYYEAAQAYIH